LPKTPKNCAAWAIATKPACCKDEMHTVVGSDRYVGGLIDMGSGHLHPLNLALGEAAAASRLGVKLFEQSAVTRIDYGPEVKVHTAQGSVRAKTLVLGCNAYLNDLNPQLSGKVLPAGSYIIATEPLSEEQAHACCRKTWRSATSGWRWITTGSRRIGACCSAVPAITQGATRRTSPPTCGRRCWTCSRSWPA
jgi:glycine/D-amino acid oxidase-like deaminating enzyme